MIEWLGHASFRITTKNGEVIYIDPYDLSDSKIKNKKADYIFITHTHHDHLNVDAIKKIVTERAKIVVPHDGEAQLKPFTKNIFLVRPNQKLSIDEINFETVPAYNLTKKFHPRENNWVGYIINLDNERIYHAGDTDFIPEMKTLKKIDFALVPVGGTYTMTYQDAAEAIKSFKPKVAIPMHWGKIIGTKSDAEHFKEILKDVCEVKIL